MSATGRNLADHPRDHRDFYATPSWAVTALLDALPDLRPTLDPCAGTGAIVAACVDYGVDVRGVEIHEELVEVARSADLPVEHGDGLVVPWEGERVIMNPPYGDALTWAQRVPEAQAAAILVRMGFLASQKRVDWWRGHPPDFIGVLNKRPSFKHGKSDNCDYVWIAWTGRKREAQVEVAWLLPS